MSHDVERLAKVLYEAFCRSERIVAKWDNESAGTRGHWAGTAREAIAAGVTLSAPVAPSPTPLQAAAKAVKAEFWKCNNNTDWVPGEAEGFARAVLAAAVGALPNAKDAVLERADHVLIDGSWILRAALLAALTEGGEG